MTTTSTILVAMMTAPVAGHVDSDRLFAPEESKIRLEQMMENLSIHPLETSPKKILGDQFVDRVRVIDQRATDIIAISFDKAARH